MRSGRDGPFFVGNSGQELLDMQACYDAKRREFAQAREPHPRSGALQARDVSP
jgi:hypothetical protein